MSDAPLAATTAAAETTKKIVLSGGGLLIAINRVEASSEELLRLGPEAIYLFEEDSKPHAPFHDSGIGDMLLLCPDGGLVLFQQKEGQPPTLQQVTWTVMIQLIEAHRYEDENIPAPSK